MKIEEGCPNALATQRVKEARVGQSTKTGRQAVSGGGNSVQLSPDTLLTAVAASAAAAAPAVRLDRVGAARNAAQAGRVGRNPWSLADRLIDSLLERCSEP
jgi:hypothetical protein